MPWHLPGLFPCCSTRFCSRLCDTYFRYLLYRRCYCHQYLKLYCLMKMQNCFLVKRNCCLLKQSCSPCLLSWKNFRCLLKQSLKNFRCFSGSAVHFSHNNRCLFHLPALCRYRSNQFFHSSHNTSCRSLSAERVHCSSSRFFHF